MHRDVHNYRCRQEGERKKSKVNRALRNCGYPEWALKEGEQRGKKVRKEYEAEAKHDLDQR